MSMRFERDERKFDFHDIGREIKRKREASGMTQEQLAFIIDRDPRTVMYHEKRRPTSQPEHLLSVGDKVRYIGGSVLLSRQGSRQRVQKPH